MHSEASYQRPLAQHQPHRQNALPNPHASVIGLRRSGKSKRIGGQAIKHIVCVIGICLLGISLGTAVAEPQLSLEVYPEEMELERYLRVWGSLRWDVPDALTDVHLAVIDEVGATRFLSPDMFDPLLTPVPFISSLYIAEGSSVDNHFFGAFLGDILAFSSNTGSYLVALALTEFDTLDLVCPPALAEFHFYEGPSQRTWTGASGAFAKFTYRNGHWHLTEASISVYVSIACYIGGTWRYSGQNYTARISGDWVMDDYGRGYIYEEVYASPWHYIMTIRVYYSSASIKADVSYMSGSCRGSGDASASVRP